MTVGDRQATHQIAFNRGLHARYSDCLRLRNITTHQVVAAHAKKRGTC